MAEIIRSGAMANDGRDRWALEMDLAMTAAIAGLESVKHVKAPARLRMHFANEHFIHVVTELLPGWAECNWILDTGEPIPDRERWEKLYNLLIQHSVEFILVDENSSESVKRTMARARKIARREARRAARAAKNGS